MTTTLPARTAAVTSTTRRYLLNNAISVNKYR